MQSYNIETKSKCSIVVKKMRFYVKGSGLKSVPLMIMFKGLGIVNEQEMVQLIGSEKWIQERLILSLEDVDNEGVFSQEEALEYIGKQITQKSEKTNTKQLGEQAREKLSSSIHRL